MAIRRTQQGPGHKLAFKYLGPYKVIEVKSNNQYDVRKAGNTEGPMTTISSADSMKMWVIDAHEDDLEESDEMDDEVESDREELTDVRDELWHRTAEM